MLRHSDLDPLRFWLTALSQPHIQHTVLILGRNSFLVNRGRHAERAPELSLGTLAPVFGLTPP